MNAMATDDCHGMGNTDRPRYRVVAKTGGTGSYNDSNQPSSRYVGYAGDAAETAPARSKHMDAVIAENRWLRDEVNRLQSELDALNNALEDDGK